MELSTCICSNQSIQWRMDFIQWLYRIDQIKVFKDADTMTLVTEEFNL